MSRRNYREAELLRRSIDGRLLDVRTSIAAEVVSFDAAKMTAKIRPGVRVQIVDEDSDPEVTQLDDLLDVPVLFPNFGGAVLYFPLEPGTPGRLEYSEEDDSQFYRSGADAPVNPVILQRHGSWAVFRPEGSRQGALIGSEPSDRGFVGYPGGVGVSWSESDLLLGGSDAADPVVRKSDLQAVVNTLNSHTHTTTATIGSSGTPGVISAPTSSATANGSATVKAK